MTEPAYDSAADYQRLMATATAAPCQADYERLMGTPADTASPAAAPPPPALHWYERLANTLHGAMPAVPVGTYPLTPPRGAGPDPDLPLEESLNPADLVLTGGMAAGGAKLAARSGPLVRAALTGLGAEVGYKTSQA